jgi:GNAT superfamily N-acetyltransferase
VIAVRALRADELEGVDRVLPLSRLGGDGEYLVAWDDAAPVGHAFVAWSGTELGLPEIQDVYVLPERRGEGVGTALMEAVEHTAASRGHARCSIGVGVANAGARRLYERLGYARADVPPKRVHGTITIRGEPVEIDDTLLYFTKRLVDSGLARSS